MSTATRRRLTVPIDGAGMASYPYFAKYSNTLGVTGYTETVEHEDRTMTTTFIGNAEVLESIAAEHDVTDHGVVP